MTGLCEAGGAIGQAMARSTELTVGVRNSPVIAMASAEDRARAFRRARRHSALVRVLRIAFPVISVLLFASYGISMRGSLSISSGVVRIPFPTLTGEDLTMNNPQYEGFGKDGSRYVVTAITARQDIKQTGPVRLDTIKARITEPNANVTVVDARRGDYDTKSGVLKAFDGIDIAAQTGMKAKLATATVQTKESIVTSDDPVLVTMPTGELRGNRMELRQKVKEVTFLDGVTARLQPEQKPAATAASSPAAAPPAGGTMLSPSNGPIDVVSERLDIDDNTKLAVFRGKVKAVQGDATLEAPELQVFYENSGTDQAPASGQTTAAPAAPDGAQQGRLKKLIARPDVTITRTADIVKSKEATFEAATNTATLTGGVVITSPPDRRVTGDRADVDTATNRIRLSGQVIVTMGTDRQVTADAADVDQKTDVTVLTGRQVVVTQGENVVRGRKMTIDRKAATSEMVAPGERVAAHFIRADAKQQTEDAKKKRQPSEQAGLTFETDPGAPIDVESDNLFVNDNAKTATFRGDVKAVQGGFVVRTPELVATYTGQSALAAEPPAAGDKTAAGDKKPAGEPGQLQYLRANKKVVITSKDQNVTGDWATVDIKANLVTVGGDVVLNQGPNVIRGPRLLIDMVTGHAKVEQNVAGTQPTSATAPGGQVTSGDGKIIVRQPGRVGAVFFPDQLKKAAQEKQGKAAMEPGAGAAAPKASGTGPAPRAATSGWSIEMEPAKKAN